MINKHDHKNSAEKVSIPCILNRASIGDAEYVFVVLRNLVDTPSKIAWVPRKDITIKQQPLNGDELQATLQVTVDDVHDEEYDIQIMNRGTVEIVKFPKGIITALVNA